ncbi:hypothetical protein ALQ02_02968 [Pseudomonas savastanoi pv. phaseolicola]|uniref:Uncharacterized protein n=1 Tax=Pseudomonas savastanoi pv. phaseolicola TaxID=319 RepID=A0ABD4BFN2_PSESH|nr:Uncharacterized protein ALO55_03749 [Pseudomonas savastanoi pv. phaseolicola]RMQ57782.1 hypothetical protein ALQ01_00855 [Pseudomonas savastanoi pv. glycinea]RMQ58515.1 hypothetical protein ALQ02_02968 [Pseudomonas savastanoi pv. phaseolicola]
MSDSLIPTPIFTLIMVDSPYSLFPNVTPKGHDTLSTLTRIVTEVTQAPHTQPPLSDLRNPATYCGRSGPKWSPAQGVRKDKVGNLAIFPERDNRGKVYLYFCPDDTTVALDDVKGIGTYGVWDTLGKKNGRQPMNELQPLRFYQRMWTKRHRDNAPVLVGKPAGHELLRADNEPRYPGGWTAAGVISQAPVEMGQLCLINAEPLAIANWRIDKTTFGIIERLPGWAKISVEAQTLVKASHAYYQRGIFPPSGLVSLTPPSLVTAPLEKGGEK